MRKIDADELLANVEKYFDGLPIVVHHDIVEMIKNAPTVEPLPDCEREDVKYVQSKC